MGGGAAVKFGLILGLSLMMSAVIGSSTFYKVKALENTLDVTGSSRKKVTSDVVKWYSSFSRVVSFDNLKSGYDQLKRDEAVVRKFFSSNGIDEKSLAISNVAVEEIYKYGQDQIGPKEYTLRQTVEVQSSDIEKITDLAKKNQELINQNVFFVSSPLEYYYSKLPEVRVDLLGDAVKDAMSRAGKLAESSGKKVGALRSASVGSVQVLQVNSTDVSDYGSYDTSKIEKEVMVTVRASFTLK